MLFTDKDKMWTFIKANKGVKFPCLGLERALWFSIEKTFDERSTAGKVGAMVRALVTYLIDTANMTQK